MTRLGPYEVHPAADLFPLMEGEEFSALVDDIKRNGLREPITITQAAILVDGRNRYRACEAAGVDHVRRVLPGHYTEAMILDLIVSENIRRRHMSPAQLAMLSADIEPMYAKAMGPQNRPASNESPAPGPETPSRHDNEAREQAAKATGASGRSTSRAKFLKENAPDLAEQVRAGSMQLKPAEREARERPDPAPRPAPVMLALRTHTGEEVPYPKPSSRATFNETTGEGISWAAWSWNPVTGCLHGCTYCYARAIANRFPDGFPVGFTPLFHEERLDAPANTSVPQKHHGDPAYKRVFVCSMADLYGRWVPDEWIQQVHASMLASPWWQYILLTKFPRRYVGLQLPPGAWVGTSVDEQNRVRIAEDAFREIKGDGIRKWLSLEPLREPLKFEDFSMFDWVVIGAQTETQQPDGTVPALQPHYDWVQRITEQARAAGCKVHHKPNLTNGRPGMLMLNEYPD